MTRTSPPLTPKRRRSSSPSRSTCRRSVFEEPSCCLGGPDEAQQKPRSIFSTNRSRSSPWDTPGRGTWDFKIRKFAATTFQTRLPSSTNSCPLCLFRESAPVHGPIVRPLEAETSEKNKPHIQRTVVEGVMRPLDAGPSERRGQLTMRPLQTAITKSTTSGR